MKLRRERHGYEGPRCPRCGRPMVGNVGSGALGGIPLNPEALCSYCLTGHGPAWQDERASPDWWMSRWARRSRFMRWIMNYDD